MRKRNVLLCICIVSFLIAWGCSSTAKLCIVNPANYAQNSRLILKDNKGLQKEIIQVGEIIPKDRIERIVKVKEGWTVEAVGSNKENDISKAGPITIPREPDPYIIEFILNPIGRSLPDDETSRQQLANAFLNLGPNLGLEPIGIKDALPVYYGALMIVVLPKDNQVGKILYYLQPSEFSNKTLTLGEFTYPSSSSNSVVEIKSSSLTKLSASIPIWGSLGISGEKDSIYTIRWSMNGYGMTIREDPAGWNYIKGISNINDNVAKGIRKILSGNSDAVLFYANKLYVIKNADFYIKEAKKIGSGVNATFDSIITAEGAYKYESSVEDHRQYQDVVLNVGGIIIPPVLAYSLDESRKEVRAEVLNAIAPEGNIKRLNKENLSVYGVDDITAKELQEFVYNVKNNKSLAIDIDKDMVNSPKLYLKR